MDFKKRSDEKVRKTNVSVYDYIEKQCKHNPWLTAEDMSWAKRKTKKSKEDTCSRRNS